MPVKLLLAIGVTVMLTGGTFAQTLKIGMSGPLTGHSESMGVAMRQGARLAVSEINRTGGVMGMPIVLVERDDESSVERGVQVAQELIDVEHVIAAVGFVDTDVALASQRFYEAAEIPVMNAVASGMLITRQFLPPEYKANYIFRTSTNDAIEATLIVREAIRRGFKSPAVLADGTDGDQAGHEELLKALEAAHVTPAADLTFNIGDTDMTTQLSRVRRAAADVMLTYGMAPELAATANSMGLLGWKLPVLGNGALAASAFIETARSNGDGSSMPQTFIQTGTTEKRANFIAAYWRTFRTGRMPAPECAAQAYDSVLLLKAAIEQANSTDGRKIREALENLRNKVEGVVTTYNRPFSPTDHEAIDANIPIFGVVRYRHVVEAHEDELTGERALRVKQ
jgi:branched-chain amino acid transport system substrate-binding protein